MAEKFISKAIKKPGAFTAQAKRAGKSVAEFAQEKRGAGGTTGLASGAEGELLLVVKESEVQGRFHAKSRLAT